MADKLEKLAVKESNKISASLGDFGGKISDGELLLPTNVYHFFSKNCSVRNINSLIATYQVSHCEGLLAKHLGWNEDEVKQAYEGLVDLVRDHVHERYLNWNPPKRAYGAFGGR